MGNFWVHVLLNLILHFFRQGGDFACYRTGKELNVLFQSHNNFHLGRNEIVRLVRQTLAYPPMFCRPPSRLTRVFRNRGHRDRLKEPPKTATATNTSSRARTASASRPAAPAGPSTRSSRMVQVWLGIPIMRVKQINILELDGATEAILATGPEVLSRCSPTLCLIQTKASFR